MNLLCGIASFFLVLSSIDPQGFQGWAPYQLHFMTDEISAGAMVSGAVLMMDSVVRIGRSIEQNKKASLGEARGSVRGLPGPRWGERKKCCC
jgi:hypothetical protein